MCSSIFISGPTQACVHHVVLNTLAQRAKWTSLGEKAKSREHALLLAAQTSNIASLFGG
jgi:hypothetical protein